MTEILECFDPYKSGPFDGAKKNIEPIFASGVEKAEREEEN
jgi:hypothetical protein